MHFDDKKYQNSLSVIRPIDNKKQRLLFAINLQRRAYRFDKRLFRRKPVDNFTFPLLFDASATIDASRGAPYSFANRRNRIRELILITRFNLLDDGVRRS